MAGETERRLFQDWLAAYGDHLDRIAAGKSNALQLKNISAQSELPEDSGLLQNPAAGRAGLDGNPHAHEQR